MPRYIVKFQDKQNNKDYYLEWSTIVDAPVTYGMSLTEFKEYYKIKYGLEGLKDLPERLQRVETNGTSAHNYDLDELIADNRAGKDETELSMEEIVEDYCRNQKH